MEMKSVEPVITMVIPTYRRPYLLRRAILSVLDQTYPHVRVCVYDNVSGDGTEEMVRNLALRDNRIKYHCHSENIGTYRNFIYGILDVKTPFYTVMSDDDMLAPTFYEKAMKAFERYPDAMLACMPIITVDSQFKVVDAPVEIEEMTYYEAGEALRGSIEGTIPGSMWSGILFRTEVRDAIGHPDANAGPFADAGYLWHAVSRFPLVTLPGVAALYMVHPQNMGTEVRMMPLDGTWPGWWDKMIKTVETDEQVPPGVRADIRKIVYPNFRKIAFQQVFYLLGQDRPDLARKAAQGLKACGHPISSALLGILVWSYDRIAIVRKSIKRITKVRHAQTKNNRVLLHEKYGHYVEFAKELQDKSEALNV